MRFQLYKLHTSTVTGIKSGKKIQILGLCGHFRDLKCDLKIKALDFKLVTHKYYA